MISPGSPPFSDACICSVCYWRAQSSCLFFSLPLRGFSASYSYRCVRQAKAQDSLSAQTRLAGGLSGKNKAWGWCHGIPRVAHIQSSFTCVTRLCLCFLGSSYPCDDSTESCQAQLSMGQSVQYLLCAISRCFSRPLEQEHSYFHLAEGTGAHPILSHAQDNWQVTDAENSSESLLSCPGPYTPCTREGSTVLSRWPPLPHVAHFRGRAAVFQRWHQLFIFYFLCGKSVSLRKEETKTGMAGRRGAGDEEDLEGQETKQACKLGVRVGGRGEGWLLWTSELWRWFLAFGLFFGHILFASQWCFRKDFFWKPQAFSAVQRNKGAGCGVLSRLGQVLSRGSVPLPPPWSHGAGRVGRRLWQTTPSWALDMLLTPKPAYFRNHSEKKLPAACFISQQNRGSQGNTLEKGYWFIL